MPEADVEVTVLRVLTDIETLRRSQKLYPPTHPALRPARERIRVSAVSLGTDAELATLGIGPDRFYWNLQELHVTAGSPPAVLARFLFNLGLAAVRLRLPTEGAGLEALAIRLATLHDPPGEQDRLAVLADPQDLADVELLPLDLSGVQVVDGETAPARKGGSHSVASELIRRLGLDGAFSFAGMIREGELDAGMLAELLRASVEPESLLDHLFADLARVTEVGDDAARRTLLSQARDLLGELIGLFDPERQKLAIAVALRHLPVAGDPDLALEPMVRTSLLLDAVELMLDRGLPIPDVIGRMLGRLAAPVASQPTEITEEQASRARQLLALLPAQAPDLARAAVVERDALIMRSPSVNALQELAGFLADTVVRAHLVRVLTEVTSIWSGEAVAATAALRLAEEFVVAVDEGDLEAAQRLAGLLAATRDDEARTKACEAGVQSVVQALRAQEKEHHPGLTAILVTLGERALPQVLAALGEEPSMAVRKRLMEVVMRQGDRAIPFLRPMIDDERWYVARNAVFLLRQLGDSEILPLLRPRAATAKPQVLEEILKSMVALQAPEWMATLVRSLDSPDPERQKVALHVASRIRHPAVAKLLGDRLRARLGMRLREPLALELIRALGRLRDATSLPLLREILELKQWRLAFSVAPLRREAAVAIAQLEGADAAQLARKLAADKDPELAAAVRSALQAPRKTEEAE